MSKFLKIMIVLLTILAVAAPAVMAEDRLSLAGSMRVRGFYHNIDEDTASSDVTDAWNDQRLRIGGKISVAEGVSVNFRFDASESEKSSSDDVAWGGSGSEYKPYSHRRADIQFDKAYLQVEKGGYTFMAGQMFFYGMSEANRLLDTVGTGFIVKRGPFTLAHVKQYDATNGRLSDTGEKDGSLTAASYAYKSDAFNAKVALAYNNKTNVGAPASPGTDSDSELYGVAISGDTNLAGFGIKGELDFFDGSDDNDDDVVGMQVYLDASTAISESVVLGGMFFYAAEADDDETQVTAMSMPIFADWKPQEYGYHTTDFYTTYSPFEPKADQGVLGLQAYADWKINDELGTKYAVGYFMPADDDDAAGKYDYTILVLNASAQYALLPNTALTAHVNYQMYDEDTPSGVAENDTDTLQAITGITVSF